VGKQDASLQGARRLAGDVRQVVPDALRTGVFPADALTFRGLLDLVKRRQAARLHERQGFVGYLTEPAHFFQPQFVMDEQVSRNRLNCSLPGSPDPASHYEF
jgi:hypothetical protein